MTVLPEPWVKSLTPAFHNVAQRRVIAIALICARLVCSVASRQE